MIFFLGLAGKSGAMAGGGPQQQAFNSSQHLASTRVPLTPQGTYAMHLMDVVKLIDLGLYIQLPSEPWGRFSDYSAINK
jgi:hypothetical protein